MLSDSQIAAFKADGALVLRSYIPSDIVDSWLQQWWDQTAASRDDAASWPGEAPAAEWRVSPKLMDLPQVAALSTQLGGPGGFTTSFPFDGHMIPTWPAREPGAEWSPSGTGHLVIDYYFRLPPAEHSPCRGIRADPDPMASQDNYGPNGWTGGLNHGFVVTAYLEDIEEGGGCFVRAPTASRASRFLLQSS